MALSLTISNGGGRGLYVNPSTTGDPLRRQLIFFPIPTSICTAGTRTRLRFVVSAAKKLSSRTGRFDSKNRRSGSATTTEEEQEERSYEIPEVESVVNNAVTIESGSVEDGFVLSDLPGQTPDFWEGPQWDAFGFFMQYMWAFGIVFALIACGIAVVTYNEGATDFKETPAYKESVQSQELLEGPEASGSDSDVFESNPTEVAPSLD